MTTTETTETAPADDRVAQIHQALAGVIDPEIHRPITELGMVDEVSVDEEGIARVRVLLTIEGCPMRDRIEQDTAEATATVPGLTRVEVDSTAMTEEQRRELTNRLRQGRRQIPFNQPGNLTRVLAISSGKGGVGKSTVTANLAASMAADGLRVGVIDADIHGFSMPGMFGIDEQPTKVSDLLMPPQAHGVAVMSIGMFVPEGQAVVWRGPKMHRAIEQFASDVFWGDLDVLLLDLPPGTGDVAISVAQILPGADGRGDHAPAVRRLGGGAGRLPGLLHGAGHRRGGGEHGRADPARRLRDGRVRQRRRRPGGGDPRGLRGP